MTARKGTIPSNFGEVASTPGTANPSSPVFLRQNFRHTLDPPRPPKYLVVTGADAKTTVVALNSESRAESRQNVERTPMRMPDNQRAFTESHFNTTTPIKNYEQRPHHYPGLFSSPGKTSTSHVNSRFDSKAFKRDHFNETDNSRVIQPRAAPLQAPTVLKPMVNDLNKQFNDGPLLNNRSPDGKILGSYRRMYADPEHVPYNEADQLGPENPMKALNDTWTAYWDNTAGACYYYNNVTGEATWLCPDLS